MLATRKNNFLVQHYGYFATAERIHRDRNIDFFLTFSDLIDQLSINSEGLVMNFLREFQADNWFLTREFPRPNIKIFLTAKFSANLMKWAQAKNAAVSREFNTGRFK
jgi:hypothetical protein